MTPHLTIYTDRFIPARFAAITAGPLILVRPAYRGDAGLLAHEMLHAKQWLLTTLAMLIVAGVSVRQRPELNHTRDAIRHPDAVEGNRDAA